MKPIATSRNTTIFGILCIVGVLVTAAKAYFDGDPTTNIDLQASAAGIGVGITAILAKGAASSGGTVDGSGNPLP